MVEQKECFRIGYAATGDPLGWMKPFDKKLEAAVQSMGCELTRSSFVIDTVESAVKAVRELQEKGADLFLLCCNALAGDGEIAAAFI